MLVVVIVSIVLSVLLIGGMGWAVCEMISTPKFDLWKWEMQDRIKNFFKK